MSRGPYVLAVVTLLPLLSASGEKGQTDWPVYGGGPMFYADTVGLTTVLARLKEFQARFGDGMDASGPRSL